MELGLYCKYHQKGSTDHLQVIKTQRASEIVQEVEHLPPPTVPILIPGAIYGPLSTAKGHLWAPEGMINNKEHLLFH